MTLDSYRNFVAIVDCGSISAASKQLLIAQPSLSNQLKNIEKTYGAKLIHRGSRNIELTEAGRIFYTKAREICRIENSISTSLSSQNTGYREQLKISIPAGNSVHYIHKLFEDFVSNHPDINYDVYEIASDFVVPNVLNNITEIGLVRASIPQYGALETFPYEKDDIVAVIPKGHPLSKKTTPIEIEEFHGIPLAIPFDISNTVYTVFGQLPLRTMLRLSLPLTKRQSNGHVHLTQSQSSLFLMRIQDILWIWLFALFMIQVCIFQVYS